MKKNLIWTVTFIFSLLISQIALAHDWQCGEGMKKVMERIKLDGEQKAKITPILDQLKSSIQANESQLRDLHTQITQQIQSDNMDQGTLDGLIDKKAKLIGDIMKAKASAKHQIYTLLNAQQKTTYQDTVKKWEDKIASKYKECHKEGDE